MSTIIELMNEHFALGHNAELRVQARCIITGDTLGKIVTILYFIMFD